MNELVQKAREFLDGITKEDKVAVIHHTDPDGICSGVIAAKAVEKTREKPIDVRINQTRGEIAINDETIAKTKGCNKIIITDMAVDQKPEQVKKLAENAKVLIIDHHKTYYDLNKEKNITMLKPQIAGIQKPPDKTCAAIFCYEIYKDKIPEMDWAAAIGIVGDQATSVWQEFLQETAKKHGIPAAEDWFKTKFGKAASIISAAESINENAQESFDTVYDAQNTEQIINSKIARFEKEVNEELNKYLEELQQKAEINEELELVYYEIKPKYNIKSPLSTVISLKNQHKTVIIADISKEKIAISARRQDQAIAMNELLEKATHGLEALGGGHIPAAGATVSKKDYPEFKKKLIEELICLMKK